MYLILVRFPSSIETSIDVGWTTWLGHIKAHLAVKALGQSICTGAWNQYKWYVAISMVANTHTKTQSVYVWQRHNTRTRIQRNTPKHIHTQQCITHSETEYVFYLEKKGPDQPVGSENSVLQSMTILLLHLYWYMKRTMISCVFCTVLHEILILFSILSSEEDFP